MDAERVVVTGLGVIASNAYGKEAFAQALREGKSGIRFHRQLRDLNFACQVGGIPETLDHVVRHHLAEDELLTMNTNMIYAAIAAIDAWADGGLDRIAPDSDEIEVALPGRPLQRRTRVAL